MSYQIKRRDKFLATTAIMGTLSFFATEAQAACTETFAGSGVWDCSGVIVTTQSPTPATGGALSVSTSSAVSIITGAGNALNLNNAIGDTNVTYLDVFTSTINGNDNGIASINNGTGSTSIISDADITGTTLDGVTLDNTSVGTNISVTTNGDVLGNNRGIKANNDGSGTTTVNTTGTVTGTTQEAINVSNTGAATNISVNTGAGAVLGANIGIDVSNSGTGGTTSVVTTGAVTGTSDYAIDVFQDAGTAGVTVNTGAGALLGGKKGILVDNDGTGTTAVTTAGNVTGTTEDGIYINNAATTTGATVNANAGIVTGNTNGIYIDHKGTGSAFVTGAANITGTTLDGVFVDNTSIATNISVTTNGNVLGNNRGIRANNDGSGTTTVNTTGSVTGTTQEAILVENKGTSTNLTVAAGAGTITGNTYGIHANSSTTGNISVSALGSVVGTTEDGIFVDHNGIGSSSINAMGSVMAFKNALYADHSVSATDMTINSGAGNISGGLSGIFARNLGSGDTTVTTGSGTVTGTADHGVHVIGQGTDVIINTGTGTISGNLNAIYADNSGSGDTIVNTSGDISGGSNGVVVANAVTTDDVTINTGAGTVTATNIGISSVNSGTGSTSITTAGDVTATSGSGISASNSGTTLNINVNSGTVSGTVSGIHTVNTGSGVTTITIAGTISGGTNSILVGSGQTTVNNTGTIDGDILFNTDDDTLSLAAGSTFSSDADGGVGNDTFNVAGDHTLGTITDFETVDISNGTIAWNSAASNVGDLTITNANVSFGGVAGSVSLDVNSMLSGTGMFDDVHINGIISPGNSAGTINVSGNYTMEQTAVYHAEVFADGTSDLIDVGGAVALNGKLEIDIVDDPEDYDIKGIFTILSADGPITGDFVTVTSENTTTTLYVMHHLRNSNVEVDFINPTEYFAPAGETINQKAASVILPHLAISSEEAEKLFHADDVEINEKLEELSGNRHGTMAGIIASDGIEYMKTVVSQTNAVGKGNAATWVNSFGLDSKAQTDGNALGYHHKSKGFAAGFGFGLMDAITIGVHGGMTWSDVTFGADEGQGRTKEAGAYITGDLDFLNFTAAYSHGWHDIETNRYLNLLGTAQNVTDTKSHKAEFEARIPFQLDQVTVEPVGGINYAKINGVAIHETGASIANLTGTTEEFNGTQVHGGLRLSARLPVRNTGVITPSAQVKFVQDIGDLKGIMTAAFEAVPNTNITSHGLTASKNRIEVDAGITFTTKGNLSFNLGYRGVYAKTLKSHGGRAGIKLVF